MEQIILYNKVYEKIICCNLQEYKLTFFTPTYNRSCFLKRIYDNLLLQTNKMFIWIIVNDGSSDDTENVVKDLLHDEKLPILYIQKENGGKHSAFKMALEQCKTEYFQCMDDDDIYSPLSVDFFIQKWKEIKNVDDGTIGAIRTLSRRKDGSFVVDFDLKESDLGCEYDATTLEVNYKMHKYQENWTCYDTNKLKSVDIFPNNYWMYDKQKFYMESLWQGRFARKYKCRYVNVSFRTYCDDAPINLTHKAKRTRQFYIDKFLNLKMLNDEQFDYIHKDIKLLLMQSIKIMVLAGYLQINLKELLVHTDIKLLKFLYVLFSPLMLLSKYIINNSKK